MAQNLNASPTVVHNSKHGCVLLVGAGPGDPELLTLKAVKAIGQATVLLVDDLVNDEILIHAAPRARIIHVGKRGGCTSTAQSLIEKLMIHEASQGEIVVRLKGGDPFIFAKDKYSHALTWASNSYRFAWYGIDFNSSYQARFYGISMDFIGNKKERFKDFLGSRFRFTIFDLSDEILERFLKHFQ